MKFQGRVVLVTGGARGNGFAIARSFAERGAKIVLNDIDKAKLKEACELLKDETNSEVLGVTGAVQIADEVKQMVKQAVDHFGRIDILINNAGIYPTRELKDMSEEEWDLVMGVNAKGTFLVSREVVNHMIEKGVKGRIINISSGNYKVARIGCAHYCGSKAAVVMLTKVLAMEVAHLGITVNSVSPGIVDVGASEEVMPKAYKEAFCKQIPNGRLGLPKDIAFATIFLASDEADYINGIVVDVDGGLGAGRYTVKK